MVEDQAVQRLQGFQSVKPPVAMECDLAPTPDHLVQILVVVAIAAPPVEKHSNGRASDKVAESRDPCRGLLSEFRESERTGGRSAGRPGCLTVSVPPSQVATGTGFASPSMTSERTGLKAMWVVPAPCTMKSRVPTTPPPEL